MTYSILRFYLKLIKRKFLGRPLGYFTWLKSGFEGPAPFGIKVRYLIKHGAKDATWVETGTYLGETTLVLSKNASLVYSLEPSKPLFNFCQNRLGKNKKIRLINGSSESNFSDVVTGLKGNVNFWLDGHFSGDVTYMGATNSPISVELDSISQNLHSFDSVCIFIDDVRLFDLLDSGYPTKKFLVDWCDANKLSWTINFDIFLAYN